MNPIQYRIPRVIFVIAFILSVFSTMHFAREAQLVPDYVSSQEEWTRLDQVYTDLVTSPTEDPAALEKWSRDFSALQTKKGDWEGLAHLSLYISLAALGLLFISFMKLVASLRYRFTIRLVLLAAGMLLTWFALADSFQKEALYTAPT